jgi:hypothetical protein
LKIIVRNSNGITKGNEKVKLRHLDIVDLNPETSVGAQARRQSTRPVTVAVKAKGRRKSAIKTDNKNRCPETGKVRYRDAREGQRRLRGAQASGRIERDLYGTSKRAESRSYPCPSCRGVHLTSQPMRGTRADYGKAA